MKNNTGITKAIFILILITLCLNPLLITKYTKDSFVLPKEIFINIVISLAFVLWLKRSITQGTVSLSRSYPCLFLLLFFTSQIISLYYCINIYEGTRKVFFTVSCVLIYFLGFNLREEKQSLMILRGIIITGIITALIGISQYLEIKIFPEGLYSQEEWKYKAFSTLGNPQFLAALLIMTFPLCIAFIMVSPHSLWYGLGAVLTGTGIVVTNTRGAYISLIGSMGLMLILLYAFKYQSLHPPHSPGSAILNLIKKICTRNIMLLFMAFLISSALLFSYIYTKKHTRVPPIVKQFSLLLPKNNTSVAGRIFTWNVTRNIIRDHPVSGVGTGNFKVVYPLYKAQAIATLQKIDYPPDFFERREYAHNEYLELWAESGFLALLFFLLFLSSYFVAVFSLLNKLPKNKRPLLIGMISSIVSIILFSVIFFPLQLPSSGILFFFLMGSSLAYALPEAQSQKSLPQPTPLSFGKKLIIIEVGCILFLFIFINNGKFIAADYYLKQGEQMIKNNNYSKAAELFKKGLRQNPGRGELFYALAYTEQNLAHYDMAIDYFKEALTLLPEKGIYYSLGNLYLKHQQFDKAEFYYQYAVAIDPSFGDAYLNLGILAIKQRKYAKALELFTEAAKQAQDEVAKIISFYNMGNAYYLLHDKENAKKYWKKMLRLTRYQKEIIIPNLEQIKILISEASS